LVIPNERRGTQRRAKTGPANVALQLLDQVSLFGDRFLDQVSDRKQADQPTLFDDRQVTQVAVGHQRHAGLDALLRLGGDHRRAHDGADRRAHRRTALQHYLACIVTFADDAHQLAVVNHRQGTHVVLGHGLEEFQHRGFGRDGVHVLVLLVPEQLRYGLHSNPPG